MNPDNAARASPVAAQFVEEVGADGGEVMVAGERGLGR